MRRQGSDLIIAKFSEDGTYTDWQISNGKKELKKNFGTVTTYRQ